MTATRPRPTRCATRICCGNWSRSPRPPPPTGAAGDTLRHRTPGRARPRAGVVRPGGRGPSPLVGRLPRWRLARRRGLVVGCSKAWLRLPSGGGMSGGGSEGSAEVCEGVVEAGLDGADGDRRVPSVGNVFTGGDSAAGGSAADPWFRAGFVSTPRRLMCDDRADATTFIRVPPALVVGMPQIVGSTAAVHNGRVVRGAGVCPKGQFEEVFKAIGIEPSPNGEPVWPTDAAVGASEARQVPTTCGTVSSLAGGTAAPAAAHGPREARKGRRCPQPAPRPGERWAAAASL